MLYVFQPPGKRVNSTDWVKGILKEKNMYGNPIGRIFLMGFVSIIFAPRILHTTKSAFQLRNDRSPADITSIPGR